MKNYIYIRFSSERQKLGDSERRQGENARRHCEHKGWPIADTFVDKAVSGWKGDNRKTGAFAQLLKVVKPGDRIIIEDNDRFGRDDPLDALVDLRNILQQGVSVVFLNNGKELTADNFGDTDNLMVNFLKQHLANQETKKKADRLQKTWRQKKENARSGKVVTRSLPAWVKLDEKSGKLTPHEQNAALVRRIYAEFIDGVPIRTIMKQLNDAKVPPFGRGGQSKSGDWSNVTIRRLLTSRCVLGEYQPHRRLSRTQSEPEGEPIPNYYPQIIDKQLFYRAQTIIERNNSPGKRDKLTATNLFSGKVKCACCGRSMFIKRQGVKKYDYVSLVCAGALRAHACPFRGIQYVQIERAVLSVLWTRIIPMLKQANSVEAQLTEKKGERDFLSGQIAKLNEALLEGNVRPKSVVASIDKFEREVEELNASIEKLEAIGQDHGLTSWVPLEQTTENRLRLASVLKEVVQTISIDAHKREAVLTVELNKDEPVSFNLAWEGGRGSNRNRMAPANTHFIFEGKRFAYVDHLTFWKSVLSFESLEVPVYAEWDSTPEVYNLTDIAQP